MKFELGNRVKLITEMHGRATQNPVWSSEFGCLGTVVRVHDLSLGMNTRVKWDNGTYNIYYIDDLKRVVGDHLEDSLFEI